MIATERASLSGGAASGAVPSLENNKMGRGSRAPIALWARQDRIGRARVRGCAKSAPELEMI